MHTKSQYFSIFIILLILVIIGYRYYNYVYQGNFYLMVNIPCDTQKEKCFVSDCDQEEEDCNQSPYKKVIILKRDAPVCLEEHDCDNFYCGEIKNCKIDYCSDQSLIIGEKCIENK